MAIKRFERFSKPLRGTGKPRLLMGIHPIPTMVTLGNLLCGFASIILSMKSANAPATIAYDYLYWSGTLVFAAMIFDVMDGKVARWTKSTSKFGMEMDSLCDVVSFGVAPAVLIKALIDVQVGFPLPDRFIWPMLAVYVSCAAIRLARYNVEAETGHRDFFFGMPSPGAAGCAASLALLIIPGNRQLGFKELASQLPPVNDLRQALYLPILTAMPFLMLVLGVLMVTRVHYPHVGDHLLRGRKSFMHVLILGLGLVLIIMHHEVMLALAFNGYMIFGLINELRFQIFPKSRPAEWVSAGEEPAEAGLAPVVISPDSPLAEISASTLPSEVKDPPLS